MSTNRPAIQAGPVTVRHIRPRRDPAVAEPGEILVLGLPLVPQDLRGLRGEQGWQSGDYELRTNEDGSFTLTLPNAAGGDGVLHSQRLMIVNDRANYEPGDEWFEIYDGDTPNGEPCFVGTPTDADVTASTITITGSDALEIIKTARETAAGFWHHAPRDVIENYCSAWVATVADDFSTVQAGAPGGYTLSGTAATANVADGRLTITTQTSGTTPAQIAHALTATGRSRIETTITAQTLSGGSALSFGIDDGGTTDYTAAIVIDKNGIASILDGSSLVVNVLLNNIVNGIPNRPGKQLTYPIAMAWEITERYFIAYVNGTAIGMLPRAYAPTRLTIKALRGTAGSGVQVSTSIDNVLVRELQPFLLRGPDKGDYHLPGKPTGGGLVAEYFDDHDLAAKYAGSPVPYYDQVLTPTRQPYARRLDPVLTANAGGSPAVWQPAGPAGGQTFSARWTGAIYLALASAGYPQINVNGHNDGVRVWIGKTRMGEQLIDDWAAGSNRNAAGNVSATAIPQVDGWYPIVVEYFGGGGPNSFGDLIITTGSSYVDPGGTTITGSVLVPSTSLSPLGCVNAQVRYDSHREQLDGIASTFGYQYTCAPRALESGQFPGQVIPRVRQGRDTAFILDSIEGNDMRTRIAATDAVSTLLLDAQGLATDGAQLTQEAVDYSKVKRHLGVHSDYVSLADISFPELLRQRAQSLIALRGSPWEEIGAQPTRKRDFIDSWPLTGAAARFRWAPGDGIRMRLPEIAVNDQTPRQILGTKWSIVPSGHSFPSVSFRQRPRGLDVILRDLARGVVQPQRNYQGQLTVVNGSYGTNPVNSSSPDLYSRITWPAATAQLIEATLIITSAAGSAQTLELNGVSTGRTFSAAGRYPITDLLTRTEQRAFARMTGGSGSFEYQLELVTSI